MSAPGYTGGFGQYQQPLQPPYASHYGHGGPAYDPHYAPYADNASHKRQRHGSGSAAPQTAPGHQYQHGYAAPPQQPYGQPAYPPPQGPVPPPNYGAQHVPPYGYGSQVPAPPPPPAAYATPYGGPHAHHGQAPGPGYGTWDRPMAHAQPPPAIPAHYPPQANYPQPPIAQQPPWPPPHAAFSMQQPQQPAPPPPPPPQAYQTVNSNANRSQRPIRRNNQQDSRNGVSRTATSLQWRPPHSSTSAAKSQSPTNSDAFSGSRPVTSSGLPATNSVDSSMQAAAAQSPTGQGRKRKVSESIEPMNAVSAMLADPIYLPTYDDGDRSPDDANPHGYNNILPTLDETDTWFWTADTPNAEHLSIGNIHWKPPEFLRQALPPTLERADALDLHTWISPRDFKISAYAQSEDPEQTPIDPQDPAARSLSAPGYTGLTVLMSQMSCSDATARDMNPIAGSQARVFASPSIEASEPSEQVAPSGSILFKNTEHKGLGQPAPREERDRPVMTTAKTVQAVHDGRDSLPLPTEDDDEEPYSPPPAGAPLPPVSEEPKPDPSSQPAESQEQPTSAPVNVAKVNGDMKRPRRGSQDRPTSKRSRAGSAAGEDSSNKRPRAHHSRSNSAAGTRHRRTGSAEPASFFPVDQAQEDALAALGVTGPAARVYNMPGPARTPSRGNSPERQPPRNRSSGQETTIDSRQLIDSAGPPSGNFASTSGPHPPHMNGAPGRRWVPPPPPGPPPPTNPSLNEPVFSDHFLRPSSANSNHTQWSGADADEKTEPPEGNTPPQPATPGPALDDPTLTPIRESPEGLSSGQKRKRAADDVSRPTRRRQAPDLSRPPKYKPPINPAYERKW